MDTKWGSPTVNNRKTLQLEIDDTLLIPYTTTTIFQRKQIIHDIMNKELPCLIKYFKKQWKKSDNTPGSMFEEKIYETTSSGKLADTIILIKLKICLSMANGGKGSYEYKQLLSSHQEHANQLNLSENNDITFLEPTENVFLAHESLVKLYEKIKKIDNNYSYFSLEKSIRCLWWLINNKDVDLENTEEYYSDAENIQIEEETANATI